MSHYNFCRWDGFTGNVGLADGRGLADMSCIAIHGAIAKDQYYIAAAAHHRVQSCITDTVHIPTRDEECARPNTGERVPRSRHSCDSEHVGDRATCLALARAPAAIAAHEPLGKKRIAERGEEGHSHGVVIQAVTSNFFLKHNFGTLEENGKCTPPHSWAFLNQLPSLWAQQQVEQPATAIGFAAPQHATKRRTPYRAVAHPSIRSLTQACTHL